MTNITCNVPASRGFGGFLRAIFTRESAECETVLRDEIQDYIEAVNLAKQDLDNVQRLFNNASDPDLIEYAIYEEYALKLRLSYLIKKAKEKNIKSAYLITT
jgi:hypothetical protein